MLYILISYAVVVVAIWLSWLRYYGVVRASLASLLRALWLLPLILLFFPQPTVEIVSNSIAKSNIHVFIDDSFSVVKSSKQKKVDKLLTHIKSKCKKSGCNLRLTKMSEVYAETSQGYSNVFDAISIWLAKTNGEPWIVISDGADSIPKRKWSEQISGLGKMNEKIMGLSIYTGNNSLLNYSVSARQDTLFGFSSKPLTVPITVSRSQTDKTESVQIQLSTKNQHLGSQNVSFSKDDKDIDVDVVVESLSKGNHLVKIVVLPVSGEKTIWDNTIYLPVEIMSNTIGVLHILGSPSWDGRYLRRYFKSEPKYDMISFFILRDPTDSQFVKERDLSLIPFPVDRLFTEELENFSAVVIQNFTLYQFLQREYQENLVKFVKNGGGLLFMGGRRSLTDLDMVSSPLAEILPFELKAKSKVKRPRNPYSNFYRSNRNSSSTYKENVEFNIEMAEPSPEQRAIAGIYDELLPVVERIGKSAKFKGLNIIENIKMDPEKSTPILNAKTAQGVKPLAIASYPGKGRALWLMSDSIHQLAINPEDRSSSAVYNDFISTSMKWLLKKEFQKPINIDYIEITPKNTESLVKLGLKGSAARYLNEKKRWKFSVCGIKVDYSKADIFNASENNATVVVNIPAALSPGKVCEVRLSGEHPSFGEVKANSSSLVRLKLKDENMFSQIKVMSNLAIITSAKFLNMDEGIYSELNEYLEKWSEKPEINNKTKEKLSENYYWFFSKFWIYILLICLPLEVLVRRWSVLFPSQSDK